MFAERALLEADQADAPPRGAAGERPLLGVPIAVKDDIDVAGEVTALGHQRPRRRPPRADAEVVRRLREAGAVIIGKTQRARADAVAVHRDARRSARRATRGTCSARPAARAAAARAAVAAGLVGAALGSDGAGSIRIPAAWCGLFGLKPQRGRVSLAPRPRAWHGLSVNGVLDAPRRRHGAVPRRRLRARPTSTSTAPDAAGGPVRAGRGDAARPAADRLLDDASRRVVLAKLDARRRAARSSETVELLRSLGHEVSERDPDYGTDAIPQVIVALPARRPRRRRASSRTPSAWNGARGRWRASAAWSAAAARALVRRRGGVSRERAEPGVRRPRRADHAGDRRAAAARSAQLQGRGALWTLNAVAGWVPYNGVWNVTGQPAASVPAGFGADGLPRVGAARRPPGRRGHAAVARRAARGRAPVGAAAPARVRSERRDAASCSSSRARGGAHGRRALLLERARPRAPSAGREQEHADRPRQRGRPRLAARDPRAARARAAPTTASWGRRGATSRRARAG